MRCILIFIAYQILEILALPLIPLYLLIRKIKGKSTIGNFAQRLGWVPRILKNKKRTVWLHAVSVGEVLSIQTLINEIKAKDTNIACYLTCGTIAAKKIAQEKLNADQVSLMPFDYLLPMLIAFSRIKPQTVMVIEAEWWPNFFLLTHFKKIVLNLINARVRETKMKSCLRLKFVLCPLLSIAKSIYVQTPEDRHRFTLLGVDKKNITVMGDIKVYNVLIKHNAHIKKAAKKIQIPEQPTTSERPIVLLAGSIHPGEGPIYLELLHQLKKTHKNIKCIFAPRHFHWQESLISQVQMLNLRYELWDTTTPETNSKKAQEALAKNDMLLVCKIGEMFSLYELADIFFLGGTFVPIGGHNLVEPAVWSKLTIIGPHYENSRRIAHALEKRNGLIKVNSPDKMYTVVNDLVTNLETCYTMGNNARTWLEHETEAVQSHMQTLINQL